MLDSLSPARRRFVVGVVLLVAILLASAAALFVATREKEVTPVSQQDLGPVLLVPGYGGSVSSLKVLQAALEQAGRDSAIVAPPENGTGDLRDQAQGLDAAARAALARSGAGSVDVIGYSAGGVVARLWVDDFGGGSLARRVVTLGSPHHGTDVAGLAFDITPDTCPQACQQLARDSDILRSLNANDESPDGPRWVSIWTTDDQVVVPAHSASLEGALNFSAQSVCPGLQVQHGGLPRDRIVIAMVLAELSRSLPKLPSRGVCSA